MFCFPWACCSLNKCFLCFSFRAVHSHQCGQERPPQNVDKERDHPLDPYTACYFGYVLSYLVVFILLSITSDHTHLVRFLVYSTFKELQIHPRSSILRVLLLKHTFSIDHSYLLAGNSYIAQLSNYLRMWTFCLFCHLQQSNL